VSEQGNFFQWQGDDLLLQVYLQPRASKDEIVGPYDGSLKIRVCAPPVDGKANKHLQKFLAKTFSVPASSVILLKGETSRNKRFVIKQPGRLPEILSTEK
jgi:uncharacterized protein (TIGR00251 family)